MMMMMGMEENRGKMVSLIVRHLPEAIPRETLSHLFSHYGALQVRPCAAAKLRNSAFLDFADEVTASQAQVQLNRLRFLGKVLSVERAGFLASKDVPTSERMPATLGEVQPAGALPISGSALNPVNVGEPIAPRLGVDYPFPSHLEYAYPPPDGNILTNIVNALIAVPRFYTQVLHLMNKMNLPAPFRAALPTPPLPLSEPVPPPPPPPLSNASKPNFAELSSDESELESSDESDVVAEKPRRKKAKRSAIVGPAVDKDVPHEAVGVKPVLLVPRNIPTIKKRNPVLQIKIASKPASCDISEEGTTGTKRMNQEKEESNGKTYATLEDIQAGKMPPEEILSLPKFKNYTAGIPSAVLYIKNLSKDVVHDDFYYIFGSFFGSTEAAKSRINIKLMQEGRMRGQAFVTFQSVDLAERALNVVNGFVFKEKPMIIQFGRSAPQGETNS